MAGVGEGSGMTGCLGWSKQRGYGRAADAVRGTHHVSRCPQSPARSRPVAVSSRLPRITAPSHPVTKHVGVYSNALSVAALG